MSALRRVAALAAVLILSPAAFAESVSTQAQAMIEQGKSGEALRLLDAHLNKNPQDAEARFTRGLALVKLDRTKDAIQVFADLSRDYPQLPEPYNNLAVLYAGQGEYEKARDALEAALATHPAYATAHENLGDIYAALAGAAYSRALQLDESNQMVRRKLSLVNQLDPGAAPLAEPPAAPAAQTSAARPQAQSMPAPVPAAAATAAAAAAATAATPLSEPVTTNTAGVAAPALDSNARAELQRAVDGWTNAWQGQNLDAYFAAYASEFVPEGGLTRSAWEAQRRERVSAPKRIKLKLGDLKLTATGENRAKADFRQEYESDAFADVTAKTLDLVRTAGGWKIVREYTR